MRSAWALCAVLVACTPATATTEEFVVESDALGTDAAIEPAPAEPAPAEPAEPAPAEPAPAEPAEPAPPLIPIDEVLDHEAFVSPRTHPLWPTASSDRCPSVMFGAIGPAIDAGPTSERIVAAHGSPGSHALGRTPSAIVPLRHHTRIAGLQLFGAINHEAGCMMGWTHTHCFVTDAVVACAERPELATGAPLQRLVQSLHLRPHDVPPEGWFELAVALSGVPALALRPDDLAVCPGLPGVLAVPPSVQRTLDGVDIRFTAVQGRTAWRYRIRIDTEGRVRLRRDALGTRPRSEWDMAD